MELFYSKEERYRFERMNKETIKLQKLEEKNNKKIEKSYLKKEETHNFLIAKQTHRWFALRTFGILFIILSILFLLLFVVLKYLNFYFNFGPMDTATNDEFVGVNWMLPFNKWSWEISNSFQNSLIEVQTASGNGFVIVVSGVIWAGTATSTMLVTREAFISNNIANGILYFAVGVAFLIGLILLIIYWTLGKSRIKKIMSDFGFLKEIEAKDRVKPLIIKEETLINGQSHLQPMGNNMQVVEEQPKPVHKTTIIKKVQPTMEIRETEWEKADPIPKVKTKRKSYPSVGKENLISEIYNDLKGTLPLKILTNIYDLTFENIVRELDQNIEEDITIVNFGKFNKVVKKAHESINPTTKEKIMVEEKQQIKFAPSPNFKKIMGQTPIKTTTKKVVKKIGE